MHSAGEVLDWLKVGNARYCSDQNSARPNHDLRQELTGGQSPHAIILGCADSRVPPEMIFDCTLGELFVIRIAGNGPTTEAIASIEYAVEVLNTPLVVVMGHTQCGALTAAVNYHLSGQELPGHLTELVEPMKLAVDFAQQQNSGDLVDQAIRGHVAMTAKKLRETEPLLAPAVRKKRVQIVGGIYHLDSGQVEFFDAPTVV
ncbi:Carbonate dehydratase [Planctomycetales bacterium 10988]|nr:Carbonate dehydratase [Planctomycetales bacterium 10988]